MEQTLGEKIRAKKRRRIARRVVALAALAAAILAFVLYQRGALRSGEPGNAQATIEIRCDAVFEEETLLKDRAILNGLPEDGVIARKTALAVTPGKTTVFDLTDQLCKLQDIQIEYSYTPGYGGYYIEGIAYLYERAAGPASGWRYTVDGKDPGRGCDKRRLSGGEQIVWYYVVDG